MEWKGCGVVTIWNKVKDKLPTKHSVQNKIEGGEYLCYDGNRVRQCYFDTIFGCDFEHGRFYFSPLSSCPCFYFLDWNGEKVPFFATHWRRIRIPMSD